MEVRAELMGRKAVIDIGSNSVKLFVGERTADGTIATVLDASAITRLGEGLDRTGLIGPEAMERSAAAVAAFHARAAELVADQVAAVGTMALRSAANSARFVEMVRAACGAEVRIIPGEEEARLSYLGALSGLPRQDGELAVFDTGGGSTEFVFGEGGRPVRRFSVDVGSVRVTENDLRSDPVTAEEVAAARTRIDREFADAGVTGRPALVVGMGGTVTTMAAVKHKMARYDPAVIQGSVLTVEDVRAQIAAYSARTVAQRRAIPGLQPGRADVILAGACILDVILERLGAPALTVSDRGLRHGLALELFRGAG